MNMSSSSLDSISPQQPMETRKAPNARPHRILTTHLMPAGDRHSDRITLHYRGTIDVIHQFTGTMADVAVENDAPEIRTEEAAGMFKSFVCGEPTRNAAARSAKQDLSIPPQIAQTHPRTVAQENRAKSHPRAMPRLPPPRKTHE